MEDQTTCTLCGEPARLLCSGCRRPFCVDHLERRFAMGYAYFCAACLAAVEPDPEDPPRGSKKRKRGA